MLNYLRKFLYVFPSKSVVLIPWLLLFIFISSLEITGLGIVGIFLNLATNPETITETPWLNALYQQTGAETIGQFIAIIGLVIVGVFCVKALISWYGQTQIFGFSYRQREKLVERLMNGYLEAPYTFHLERNSARIIHNTLNETNRFADSILRELLTLSFNLVNVVAISILLCLINPLAVFSLVVIVLPLAVLFNSYRDRMRVWGKEIYQANQGIIRNINHGLGGLKETRIIGCGPYFAEKTVHEVHRFAEASVLFYGYKLSPRFIVETLLVLFLVGFTSIYLLINRNIDGLTSSLGVFAFASIRLIPAFSNIATEVSELRTSSYPLTQIYQELKELEELETSRVEKAIASGSHAFPERMTDQIVIEGVAYTYPQGQKPAVAGIDLTIKKGQSIALIGRSGSGKTTLVDLILGLLVPQAGDIHIDGVSIYNDLRSWQNLVGYIPQFIFLIDDTIERNIAFGVPDEAIDAKRLDRAIDAAQLRDVVDQAPDGVKTNVGERGVMLSGGQRQRIGIARALYHEREILVLDEATSALDNETEALVTESIRSLSGTKTMIIIAHRLTTVEHCDRIYLLEQGKVVKAGTYAEVVQGETVSQSEGAM